MKARLLVELNVKPEMTAAFQAMFNKEFVARSRTEPGCELYELWHDPTAPNKMTIVEVWSSKADWDKHIAQDWFAEWSPRMAAMQASPIMVRTLASFED